MLAIKLKDRFIFHTALALHPSTLVLLDCVRGKFSNDDFSVCECAKVLLILITLYSLLQCMACVVPAWYPILPWKCPWAFRWHLAKSGQHGLPKQLEFLTEMFPTMEVGFFLHGHSGPSMTRWGSMSMWNVFITFYFQYHLGFSHTLLTTAQYLILGAKCVYCALIM